MGTATTATIRQALREAGILLATMSFGQERILIVACSKTANLVRAPELIACLGSVQSGNLQNNHVPILALGRKISNNWHFTPDKGLAGLKMCPFVLHSLS